MGTAVFQKSTNKPIEFQSKPRPGTCLKNAIAAGYPADDLEERTITLAEYLALVPKGFKAPKLTIDALAELLVEKKVLSAQDVEGKKK